MLLNRTTTTTGCHHMPSSPYAFDNLSGTGDGGPGGARCALPAACRLVLLVLALVLATAPVRAEEEVTLNFKDADLNVVIQTVADITGRNFVIDPRVKGKVTVVSSRPMGADEIYQVFLSVLEVHGFAAIPDGSTIRIVPAANAKQGGLPVVTGARQGAPSNDMITHVVQVEHVSAAQLVPVLRPLVPPQGHMAAYQATNTLIISDRAANIARLRKIIKSIDRPGSSEVEVIRLQHASAAEVVRILSSLQQKGGKGKAQGMEGPLFVADERTNSILLGGDPAERLRMRRIITELDTPIEMGGGNTQVVYLRYAKASDLVKVLTGISEAEKKAAQQQAAGVRRGGQAKGGKSPPAAGPAGRAMLANVSIQADEGTNALIITAPPDQFRSLQAVIAKLDIPRAQVLVETIIAEVSLDRKRELGVEWIVDGTAGGSGVAPIGTIDFGGISGLAANVASAQAGKGLNLSSGLAMVVGSIGGGGTDFGALLRALTSDGSTNVLSTPNIVTMDNEEAEIVVGENRPFITGSYTTPGGTSTPTNPFQTIKREDVGLKLKVRPQINEGSAIKLEIEQEISSVSQDSELGPYTNKRSIKTSVMVDNGKILVLGGLIDDKMVVREQRVPLLGDIPVLGWLFRYNKTAKEKRNLMVFMRPVILRDQATIGRLTGDKYNYMRGEQLEIRNSLSSLMRAEDTPLMEELDDTLQLPPPFEETGLEREIRQLRDEPAGTDLALPPPSGGAVNTP